MFRIGEFSGIARLPGRLRRYYDRTGRLSPRRVDAATGYRYYTADQLNFHDLGHALDPAPYPKPGRYFRRQIRRPAFRQAPQAERPFADSMGLSTAFLAASDPVTA